MNPCVSINKSTLSYVSNFFYYNLYREEGVSISSLSSLSVLDRRPISTYSWGTILHFQLTISVFTYIWLMCHAYHSKTYIILNCQTVMSKLFFVSADQSSANFQIITNIDRQEIIGTMKFLLLLAFAVLVRTDEVKKDQGVLVLEKETFQSAITDNKFILVEFCKYFLIGPVLILNTYFLRWSKLYWISDIIFSKSYSFKSWI